MHRPWLNAWSVFSLNPNASCCHAWQVMVSGRDALKLKYEQKMAQLAAAQQRKVSS